MVSEMQAKGAAMMTETCAHCRKAFLPLGLGFVSIPDERYERLCLRCKLLLTAEPVTEERLREFTGMEGLDNT